MPPVNPRMPPLRPTHRAPARAPILVALALLPHLPAMAALDLASLWDFSAPALAEQRFRAALADAKGDDRLILTTQIARTHGLRRDFEAARRVLAEVEAPIRHAGAEARVRYQLELGRSWASATHPPASQTDDARARARGAFDAAWALARENRLDSLAIDAIHMLAFVDTAPEDQEKWAREALAVVESSTQPAARRWEGAVRNNLGYALHQRGRHAEALAEFERALAVRQREGKDPEIRIARWMVAWTLRALGRADEALAMQLQLADDCERAGQPDPYVFEELEVLYRTRGEVARAEDYAARRRALKP